MGIGISMSIDMMYGIAIVAFLVLVAMIGTFSDTKSSGGLKWFLLLLIILGAGAGGAREYFRNKTALKDQKKMDEVVALNKSCDERSDEKLAIRDQAFAKEREGLRLAIKQSRASSMALVEQIASLADSIEEMEKAAEKARKREIADLGMKIRLDASKKLVETAKEGRWMSPSDITNLEAWFKEDLPLKRKSFEDIKESLGDQPIGGGEATR